MRTLLCVRFSPYPPIGGSALRNWQNISAFAALGRVGVFSCLPGPAAVDRIPDVDLWRHVDSRDHLQRLKRGRRVPSWLRTSDSRVEAVSFAEAIDSFNAMLRGFEPDLVVFEEIWFYHYLKFVRAGVGAKVQVIVDNHNVETDVLRARQSIRGAGSAIRRLGALAQRRALFSLEGDFCRQADQVWACSDVDAELLAGSYGIDPATVRVVPNCVDTAWYEAVRSNSIQPSALPEPPAPTILYAGSYGYFPNRHAAKRLIDRIYPMLRRRVPNIRLLLVGPSPTEEMLEAASGDPSILVTGLVDDVRPYYAAADLIVVPLEHGSGTRLKILEAFAASRPVVSTRKGLEGLDVADGEQALIADDDERFARAVIRLLNDASLRRTLTANARALVEKHYSFGAAAERIKQLVQDR